MTPDQEAAYIARSKTMIEESARRAIEELRLERSTEPTCLLVSPMFMEAGMHVGTRTDRPGTIVGHIDERQIGRLHVFNLPVYPVPWLQGVEALAAVIAR